MFEGVAVTVALIWPRVESLRIYETGEKKCVCQGSVGSKSNGAQSKAFCFSMIETVQQTTAKHKVINRQEKKWIDIAHKTISDRSLHT